MSEASQAIVVRPATTVREEALAMVARSMPLGEEVIRLVIACDDDDDYDYDDHDDGTTESSVRRGSEKPARVVELRVISFPFGDHGVGGVLWQAAVVLAQYVATVEAPRLKRERLCQQGGVGPGLALPHVVELGCGSACLGGLAAQACGLKATVTDLPEVLKLSRRTLRRNEEARDPSADTAATAPVAAAVAAPAIRARSREVVSSVALAWGPETLPLALTRRGAASLVVGADIMYRCELHRSLLATLRTLCAPYTATAATTLGEAKDKSGEVAGCAEAADAWARAKCLSPPRVKPPRVVLAYQSRHPVEEGAFMQRDAPAFGFTCAFVSVGGLPGLSDWHRAHVRMIELTWSPPTEPDGASC